MSEHQMPAHGSFCWNELACTDDETAKKFYAELLGWTFKEGDVPPSEGCEGGAAMKYTEIVAAGRPSGGIYKMGAEFGGAPSHWMAYIAVDDVDAAAKKVEELGGKLCVPPTDIPNVGRFSVITDPTGAALSLITLKRALS